MSIAPHNIGRHKSQGCDGRIPSCFISYSHQDREILERILKGVEEGSQRVQIWFDEMIEPGDLFTPTIEEKIGECNALLFLASRSSVKSRYCRREILLAEMKEKRIIPLRLHSEVDLPRANLPLEILDIECINLSDDFESGVRKLCTVLARMVPESPPPITTEPLVINDPPFPAPVYFVGRHKEHQDIEEFISSTDSALLWIWGRAGSGKTALACRVLEHLRCGAWLSPRRMVPIHAIAYLNQKHQSKTESSRVLDELRKLLLRIPSRHPQERHLALAVDKIFSGLSDGRAMLLVDGVDELIDPKTGNLTDLDLFGALEAVLTVTGHRLKVIATSRILPLNLPVAEQARWRTCNLATGLPQSETMQLFRVLDHDGTIGLRDGSATLLMELCRRTLGNPRAIETLYARLANDRAISPIDVLRDENSFLPDEVLDVLIGESYACLDDVSKTMMQVLSVSESSASVDAVASVFRRYYRDPDIDPLQVLNRLVNMQLVQSTNQGYFLRHTDRCYMASKLVDSTSSIMGGDYERS